MTEPEEKESIAETIHSLTIAIMCLADIESPRQQAEGDRFRKLRDWYAVEHADLKARHAQQLAAVEAELDQAQEDRRHLLAEVQRLRPPKLQPGLQSDHGDSFDTEGF